MIRADFWVFPSALIFLKQLQMSLRLAWMRSKEIVSYPEHQPTTQAIVCHSKYTY